MEGQPDSKIQEWLSGFDWNSIEENRTRMNQLIQKRESLLIESGEVLSRLTEDISANEKEEIEKRSLDLAEEARQMVQAISSLYHNIANLKGEPQFP